MDFIVPKFIDREPKIMGPFTFKQFMYLLIPAMICFFLYFFLKKKHPVLFIFTTVVLMVSGLAFTFIKIKGIPLSTFLKNFFDFSLSSKIFIWRRKMTPHKIEKIQKVEEKVETQSFKTSGRSRLQKISVDLETRKK